MTSIKYKGGNFFFSPIDNIYVCELEFTSTYEMVFNKSGQH